jgi:hypothetical protein
MIKLTAGAVMATPLAGLGGSAEAGSVASSSGQAAGTMADKAPRFFTREELAVVDELTELIIPTDDHSPGARAAQVAQYIDQSLAESFGNDQKELWRNGLKLLDDLSKEMNGKGLLKASSEERVALLTRISKNEEKPETPEEKFFEQLKGRTARAYYTSNIGIHQEMEYKGNTYLKEFVGYDAT